MPPSVDHGKVNEYKVWENWNVRIWPIDGSGVNDGVKAGENGLYDVLMYRWKGFFELGNRVCLVVVRADPVGCP